VSEPRTWVLTIPAVIGIDPGGAATGIAVITSGDELAWSTTVRRERYARISAEEPISHYARKVTQAIIREAPVDAATLWAIEEVHAPNPHLGLTNPQGAIDTAVVFGALIAHTLPGLLAIVETGRHGRAPMTAYPPSLRPTRGQGKGKDNLRHCRSAYDIAIVGIRQWRTEKMAAQRNQLTIPSEVGR
jgi:hypothetical protein